MHADGGRPVIAHTPGPWKVEETSSGPIYIEARDGRALATLAAWSSDDMPGAAANARLMAAAPDLLEALRFLVLDVEHYGAQGVAPTKAAMNAAKDAVAKATGFAWGDTR